MIEPLRMRLASENPKLLQRRTNYMPTCGDPYMAKFSGVGRQQDVDLTYKLQSS